jgi:polyisoprenoid-binding protein YceI
MKTKWTLDPMHSDIHFKIRHLVISSVSGHLAKFNADVETEGDDFHTAKVYFTADVNSIDTGSAQRDEHLKSADFFDAANHPTIEFVSTGVEASGDNKFILNGNLTMRGVTKPVSLEVEFGGLMKDPYGNLKSGFEVTGKINRHDFGLQWSALTEAGGAVVGDEVKISAALEFAKVVPQEEKGILA